MVGIGLYPLLYSATMKRIRCRRQYAFHVWVLEMFWRVCFLALWEGMFV